MSSNVRGDMSILVVASPAEMVRLSAALLILATRLEAARSPFRLTGLRAAYDATGTSNPAELARACGVSAPTLRRLIAGTKGGGSASAVGLILVATGLPFETLFTVETGR